MTAHVLFIQGAGDGAHDEDAALAESLRQALGDDCSVRYPRMRHEGDAEYADWKEQIADELAGLDGDVALVGHSIGGSVLLKYLTEAGHAGSAAGAFILAAPYWGADAYWSWEECRLPTDAARSLAEVPIYLYHSRDDEVVPFAHLALYAAALPQAVVRRVDGRGHQFGNDLSDVARDIATFLRGRAQMRLGFGERNA